MTPPDARVSADPLERARRRRVIAATVVIVVLLAAVALKVTSMQVATKFGERAWRSDDLVAAEKWFAVTEHLNLVERWVAPYNRGVVAHSGGQWREAANWYDEALRVAPESARCRIALNWTWALESAGDELAEAGDEQTAAQRWAEANRVLAEADGCDEGAASRDPSSPSPTPDDSSPEPSEEPTPEDDEAGSEQDQGDPTDSDKGNADQTRKRLEKKLKIGDAEPEPGPQEQAPEDQADRLTDRNREGAREKQRNQDQREGKPDDGNHRTW